MSRIDVNKDCVQAVITAPTRELASQLFNNAKTFTKYLPELRVSLIVGGSDRQYNHTWLLEHQDVSKIYL